MKSINGQIVSKKLKLTEYYVVMDKKKQLEGLIWNGSKDLKD